MELINRLIKLNTLILHANRKFQQYAKRWRKRFKREIANPKVRSVVVTVATGLSVDDTIPSGWERQIIGLLGHLPRRYIIIVSCIGELV